MRSNDILLSLLVLLLIVTVVCGDRFSHLKCRDPDFGGGKHSLKSRKFLVITGIGGGIGNYLVFYPAAYFFSVLTGRDIVILDNSLIGQMCKVIYCGFPLYSQMAKTYPSIFPEDYNTLHYMKISDFGKHLHHEIEIKERVILATGYMMKSGWYLENEYANWCIPLLTGCEKEDVSCHDRHALEQLIRGPFHSQFQEYSLTHPDQYYIAGIPKNLRHGILSLPHAIAPRIDAAIHLRCQFKYFEYVVAPEDSLWKNYMEEVTNWLAAKDQHAGNPLFHLLEQKLLHELTPLIQQRLGVKETSALLAHASEEPVQHRIYTGYEPLHSTDLASEHNHTYQGSAKHDPIYLYVSSDNDRVKEAFIHYIQDRFVSYTLPTTTQTTNTKHAAAVPLFQFLRVKQLDPNQVIQHAKNMEYLTKQNASGSFNLIMDWYALSLANHIFAWRRDTHYISTYVQSAIRMSGNSNEFHMRPTTTTATETATEHTVIEKEKEKEKESVSVQDGGVDVVREEDMNEEESSNSSSNGEKETKKEHARGFYLIFRGTPKWKEF